MTSNCSTGDKNIEAEIKKEVLEDAEMPTFESEATYLERDIKKEIKIEPCGIQQHDQMFETQATGLKSNQGIKDLNYHDSSRIMIKLTNLKIIKKNDNDVDDE